MIVDKSSNEYNWEWAEEIFIDSLFHMFTILKVLPNGRGISCGGGAFVLTDSHTLF